MKFTEDEMRELEDAVYLLENPGFAARISNAVGWPIERVLSMLPKGATSVISKAGEKAIQQSLNIAVLSLGAAHTGKESRNLMHKLAASASGGVGGAFGLGALAVEIPISTTIMMRSIADIARSQGEDLRIAESRLSVIQVFALGSATDADDAAESAYWASRIALGRLVSEAAKHVAEKGVAKAGAPPLVRLVAAVAARFQIPLTQKVAAQAIPLVGAIGGAGINLLFIDHFQDMARGHFTIRRFERTHGVEETRGQYGIILARMNQEK